MGSVVTKGRTVLALLALAGVLWYLSGLQWGAKAPGAESQVPGVAEVASATGEEGHPLLTAGAAVLAVSALLLTMLGRAGRIVVLALVGLVGAGVIGAAAAAPSAPAASIWPTIAAGAAVVLTAIGAGIVSPSWRVSGRYDRRTEAAHADPDDDPAAAWDALSRGEDPS